MTTTTTTMDKANSSSDVIDLTREVQRDAECFHCGERADVWKGRLFGNGASKREGQRQDVVIKVLRIPICDRESQRVTNEALLRLFQTWTSLSSHPNIVPFYGIIINRDTQAGSDTGPFQVAAPVVPYYPNGNILDYLGSDAGSGASRVQLVTDVARALKYLHALSPPIVHGNVRGSNILISSTGTALLSDVGLGIVLDQPQLGGEMGAGMAMYAARWMAPELLIPDCTCGSSATPGGPTPTTRSDVYSWGMTVLEVYTLKPPFSELKHDARVIFNVVEGVRPDRPGSSSSTPSPTLSGSGSSSPEQPNLNDALWTLLQICWEQDPMDRPSAQDLVRVLKEMNPEPTLETASASTSQDQGPGWRGGFGGLGSIFGGWGSGWR